MGECIKRALNGSIFFALNEKFTQNNNRKYAFTLGKLSTPRKGNGSESFQYMLNQFVIFRAKIKGSLIQINESATYSDLETGELTQSQVLRLCVYLMEKDSKFSGNGFDMHYFTAKFADDEILAMIDIIQIVFGTAPIEQKPPIF